jgi:ATP-binding cassette subfamily B protein
MLRFYDIQKGEILLDGRDIRLFRLRDLRRQIAIVLQEVFLFSGTIADNIRLGDDNIDDDQIAMALKMAYADAFISHLSHQMDTPVTERGSTFSAGQRQLLSFARAIARKPAIFVLDEATANIDTETEQQIQQSIAHITRQCTTIIIAHGSQRSGTVT